MGLTALHGAANRGSDDIIRFLVEKGAKLDVKDKEGRTPMTWAEGVFLATHPGQAEAHLDCAAQGTVGAADPRGTSDAPSRTSHPRRSRPSAVLAVALARRWIGRSASAVRGRLAAAEARRCRGRQRAPGHSRRRPRQPAAGDAPTRRFSSSTCITCHNERAKSAARPRRARCHAGRRPRRRPGRRSCARSARA